MYMDTKRKWIDGSTTHSGVCTWDCPGSKCNEPVWNSGLTKHLQIQCPKCKCIYEVLDGKFGPETGRILIEVHDEGRR